MIFYKETPVGAPKIREEILALTKEKLLQFGFMQHAVKNLKIPEDPDEIQAIREIRIAPELDELKSDLNPFSIY